MTPTTHARLDVAALPQRGDPYPTSARASWRENSKPIKRRWDKRASAIETERWAIKKRSEAEDARWEKQKEKLEIALRRAGGLQLLCRDQGR
jgi:hypothetical protein